VNLTLSQVTRDPTPNVATEPGVFHREAERDRAGTVDLPIDRRGAWAAAMDVAEPAAGTILQFTLPISAGGTLANA
jgi:hypothetical protein